MQTLLTYLLLCLCMMCPIFGRTLFDQLFQTEPRTGYYYPATAAPYEAYRPARPTAHQRSYKDICRMVNTNGFTNPGSVPRCPY